MKTEVFWSENHYIMNCSNELLLKEYINKEIDQELLDRIYIYLQLKSIFGFAEFLSPVYMPFTIQSLLNLYDYTKYEYIRILSKKVLDRISNDFLNVSLPGSSLISPSGRSYIRHRLTTQNKKIGLFLEFLQNKGILKENDDIFRERLMNTTYQPSVGAFWPMTTDPRDTRRNACSYQPLLTQNPSEVYPLSPSLSQLYTFLDQQNNISLDVFVSLLWSHGIYISMEMKYIKKIVQLIPL
jgi:hypothetical protein